MKKYLLLLLISVPLVSVSQTGSEIYLLDVQLSKSKISISNPVNVTNHPGYDNQPSFHKRDPILYYASFNEEGRSDIKTYNYNTGETSLLTTTSEREYSPTLTPDGQYISCIIQRDNGAQDLGQYPVGGGEAMVLIDNLIVGYHAWVNANQLMLFVLGDPMTLQLYDLKSKTSEVIENNIGRSLHQIPGEQALSFVHKKSEKDWVIQRIDKKSRKISPIVATLPGREDLTWTNDGRIIMSDGMKLFFYNPKSKGGWTEIEFANNELKGISRLAISQDGKKLAIVVSE